MTKKVIFDKKNVLVAGGAGFIGSHLCDELVKTCKVICIDNFLSGSEKNIDHLLSNPDFAFINYDLVAPLDLESFPELQKFKVQFQGIQEVYNLACPMSVRNFNGNKMATVLANSTVVKNLLDLAVRYQAKFFQASSSVVYGQKDGVNNQHQVKESDLGLVDNLSNRACYDEGKRFAETLVKTYHETTGLDTRLVRLFRVYGPRMPLNDDQLIPDFINDALNGSSLTIFGHQDFSSSFCYIDDIIDGIVKVMEADSTDPINLGSDIDIKISDLAALIIAETGSASTIQYADKHIFIGELLLPDIYQARNSLGWMPVVTLENGLKKTIFDLQASQRLQSFNQ
jgi:UDP-glucuronate decarboxylase